MARIRTTINPYEEVEVSEATLDDLRAQNLVLEGTRATTPDGLLEAAVKQVREGSYTDETRAGIADAERRAAESKKRKAPTKRAPRARARQAPATNPAAPAAVADPAPADGTTSDDQASADVVDTPSGVAPADTTQES